MKHEISSSFVTNIEISHHGHFFEQKIHWRNIVEEVPGSANLAFFIKGSIVPSTCQ